MVKEIGGSIGNYFRLYNTERLHQTLGYQKPAEVFNSILVEVTSTAMVDMVESLTPNSLRIAGPALNTAPILSY
jgi:hypothetical protein